jgi:hypothetical protein
MNFHENRPLGAELLYADGRTDGQTDRRDEANSSFSEICESAQKRLSSFQPAHCVQLTLRLQQWFEARGQQTPGGPRLSSKATAFTGMALENSRNFGNIPVPPANAFFFIRCPLLSFF